MPRIRAAAAGPEPEGMGSKALSDSDLLDLALTEALAALSSGEVPAGAALLMPSGAVFAGRNRTRQLGAPWAHAEHIAISAACAETGDWRLEGSVLACTLEPCLMCTGLAVLARVKRIVFGAADTRFGALGSVTDVRAMKGLNHYPDVNGPIDAERCGELIRGFFRNVRQSGACNQGSGAGR
jgi:tRNA(adenine34) deaminase